MGRPPYADPDPLDRMRADCVDVDLGTVTHEPPKLPTAQPGRPTNGFEVPTDAVTLGERHFHLD